jgi:hypothetical protein
METVAIQVQRPVQPDVSNGEAHEKEFLDLPLSFQISQQVPMRLGRLVDGRLRVAEPFVLTFSSAEGQFIAEAPEVDEVGVGETQSEALRDLQTTLGELYWTLEENEVRLESALQEVLTVLRRKIERRRI